MRVLTTVLLVFMMFGCTGRDRVYLDVEEASGLINVNNRLFTINDSKNGAYIYEIGKDGKTIDKIHVPSSNNTDWESITLSQDGENILIGDIGDNHYIRDYYSIYVLDTKELLNGELHDIEEIKFKYEDEVSHDAETIMHHNDTIYIITKEWDKGRSGKLYMIYQGVAYFIINIDTPMMITDGKMDDKGDYLLLGYDKLLHTRLFTLKKEQLKEILIIPPIIGQCEGLSIKDNIVNIVCEDMDREGIHIEPKLYTIELKS